MRYCYGIMDEGKILLYQPQLFLESDDVLVFPSQDFSKWHGDIKEYIDGLYQINSMNMEKSKSINIEEFNLAVGVLHNITDEIEHLFDHERTFNSSYQYISTLKEKYMKTKANMYTSDMRRCDIRIPVIPVAKPWIKYQNMMEIVDHATREFTLSRRKKQKKLTDLIEK